MLIYSLLYYWGKLFLRIDILWYFWDKLWLIRQYFCNKTTVRAKETQQTMKMLKFLFPWKTHLCFWVLRFLVYACALHMLWNGGFHHLSNYYFLWWNCWEWEYECFQNWDFKQDIRLKCLLSNNLQGLAQTTLNKFLISQSTRWICHLFVSSSLKCSVTTNLNCFLIARTNSNLW